MINLHFRQIKVSKKHGLQYVKLVYNLMAENKILGSSSFFVSWSFKSSIFIGKEKKKIGRPN